MRKKSMKEFVDPFLYNLSHLDLHGYDRTGAVAVIKLFIDERIRMGEKKFVIVHGKGTGILKKTTHEYLKTNSDSKSNVEFFEYDWVNDDE